MPENVLLWPSSPFCFNADVDLYLNRRLRFPGSPRFKCSKPLHLNRRLRHYFCGPSSAFDFVALFPNGNLPPDEDWALALAREAVIRPLADDRSIGSG